MIVSTFKVFNYLFSSIRIRCVDTFFFSKFVLHTFCVYFKTYLSLCFSFISTSISKAIVNKQTKKKLFSHFNYILQHLYLSKRTFFCWYWRREKHSPKENKLREKVRWEKMKAWRKHMNQILSWVRLTKRRPRTYYDSFGYILLLSDSPT